MTNKQTTPDFIFATCQVGAESSLRKEVPANHPELKLAFSRPGFVTFKVDPKNQLPERFTLKSTLARNSGWSLGKAKFDNSSEIIAAIIDQAGDHLKSCDAIHVWQRESKMPALAVSNQAFRCCPVRLENKSSLQ